MATDAAQVVAPEPTRTARPAPRQYWQWPVFVLGAVAAIAAYQRYPYAGAAPQEVFERDRQSLRQALDRKPVDAGEVRELATRLGLPKPGEVPDAATCLTIGSAHLLLAEQDTSGTSAEAWMAAHAWLSLGTAANLPEKTDRERYAFRLAKATAAVGQGDAAELIRTLEMPPPPGDDAGERSRLIAELCLKMTPPDTLRAKKELTAYLSGPPRGAMVERTRLRLRLAELCQKTGERDRAKSWLRDIGENAPAEQLASAKVQLAQMLMMERDFNEAVKLFEATERLPGLTPDQRAVVRYETGSGLLKMGNTAAAKDYFQKASQQPGHAGQAAKFRLAEIVLLTDAGPKQAAEHLADAVRGTKAGSEYKNPYFSLPEAQGLFEKTIHGCRGAGDFETAARTATVYSAIASNGFDRLLYADTLVAWAGKPGVADARGKLLQAAAEFVKQADGRTLESDKAKLLGDAHAAYSSAGEAAEADKVLAKLAALPGAGAEVLGRSQLTKAQGMLDGKMYAEAVPILAKIEEFGGGLGLRAAVKRSFSEIKVGQKQLGDPLMADAARGKIAAAFGSLKDVANRSFETPDEKLAHEEALYHFGRFLIDPIMPETLNVAEAETRFRKLVQDYPTGNFVDQGKLYRGICLFSLAKGGTGLDKIKEAKELFVELGSSKDEWVRIQADVRRLYAMLQLKELDALVEQSDKLAEAHRGTAVELVILNFQNLAHTASQRPDLARKTSERMKAIYDKLPETAYRDDVKEFRKAHWDEIFKAK